jgi:MFS superfamily sulfate permease-like transporter
VSQSSWRVRHTPKLVICLREGYSLKSFMPDLGAGLTVAVIALPLSMALGIASIPQNVADQLAAIHPWLTPPAMGLFTAVIAGFLISSLGGSRVQIGGAYRRVYAARFWHLLHPRLRGGLSWPPAWRA